MREVHQIPHWSAHSLNSVQALPPEFYPGRYKIEIVPDEINTTLSVFEEPLDTQDVYAEKYRNVTKHRVASPKFPSGIRKELENRNLANEGVVMSSPDIKAYLDTLVATIPADSRDSVGTRIMVKGDTIYTAPQLYFAMMENKLDESFADFVLPTSAANFLKSFLTFEDTVQFSKTQLESVILLKFVNSKSVAFVAALPATNALDCTPHKAHSNTGIVIDKQYFNDLLKRAPSQDACVVDIEICGDGTASGKIMSKTWKQDFVVLKSRLDEKDFEGHSYLTGTGENAKLSLNFSIRAELLKQLIFAQTNIFEDKVFMYFEAAGNTGIRLACRDDTGIWQTKINTLTPKRGEFNWED